MVELQEVTDAGGRVLIKGRGMALQHIVSALQPAVTTQRRIHGIQRGAGLGFFHAIAWLGLRDDDVFFALRSLRRGLRTQRRRRTHGGAKQGN